MRYAPPSVALRVIGALAIASTMGACKSVFLRDAQPDLSQYQLVEAPGAAGIRVPQGLAIEPVVENQSYLVDVTFAPDGTMYFASAGGHTYGTKPEEAPPPAIFRRSKDGKLQKLDVPVLPLSVIRKHPTSALMPEGIITPITGITYHQDKLIIAHRSRVSVLDLKTNTLKTIVNGMPSWGEFLNHKVIVGPDQKLYFVLSTQGNAGVIETHWLKVMDVFNKPDAHEVPGEDVTLRGVDFPVPVKDPVDESGGTIGDPVPGGFLGNLQKQGKQKVMTGVYVPLGTTTKPGQVIQGQVPANGGFHRVNLDGSGLELIAWGLRSNFGYRFTPSGRVIATQNSGNPMPPRRIFDDWEPIYEIKPGTWYGWPDFFSSKPITDDRFRRPNDPQFNKDTEPNQFVLTEETHKRLLKGRQAPPEPLAKLTPHSAAEGLVMGSRSWGMDPENEILVAEMGNIVLYMRDKMPGFKVQRVNLETGEATDFLVNISGKPASMTSNRQGLERPIQLEWGPDGALYVVDFGRIELTDKGMNAYPNTAKIWRVAPQGR